jgi:hypothetical protein
LPVVVHRAGDACWKVNGMCNLYNMTKTQDAMRQLFRFKRDRAGNLPPLPGSSRTIGLPTANAHS